MLLRRQPFSWSFTQVVSASTGDRVPCLVCRCQRGPRALETDRSAVSVPGDDGQLESGRWGRSWPWELTAHCGPGVAAGREQGCRSLMLWPCSEEASQRMFWVRSQENGCPVLTPASGRASLLWTSYVFVMSHRTVWTKTIDKIRLTTTSEESQKTWGLVIRNSWSLRKSSCTTWAWTWIWNVKLRMRRVQKERELNLELRSHPSVSLKKKKFFFLVFLNWGVIYI